MSQNTFTTSSVAGTVRVRAGWDVPLQELFCSVEQLERFGDEEQLPDCFFQTSYGSLEEMVLSLSQAGITLPPGLIQAVRQDIEHETGNVLRDFDATPPTRTP